MRSSLASAHDLGGGVLRRPRVDDLVPLVPAASGGRTWLLALVVVDEIGTLDEQQEAVELLAAVGAEADVAVEGRLDRRRLDGARGAGDRRAAEQRADVLGVAARGDGHHLGDREVDVVTVARCAAARRAAAATAIAENVPANHSLVRPPAWNGTLRTEPAPDEPARLRLHDELGRRALGVRAGAAVRRDRAHDQAGVRVEPAAAGRTRDGEEALDHDVGAGDERLDLRVAGTTDDRAHPVVQELEQRAAVLGVDLRAARRPRAPRVTAGRFDLHRRRRPRRRAGARSSRRGSRC